MQLILYDIIHDLDDSVQHYKVINYIIRNNSDISRTRTHSPASKIHLRGPVLCAVRTSTFSSRMTTRRNPTATRGGCVSISQDSVFVAWLWWARHKIWQNHGKNIPLGISSKELDNPGCRKKKVFLKTKWFFYVANPDSPLSWDILGHDFLERAFSAGIDMIVELLKFEKKNSCCGRAIACISDESNKLQR